MTNLPRHGRSDLRLFEHSLIVDLAVDDGDMKLVPPAPQEGETVTLDLIVHNAGDFPVGPFDVELYVGEPESGGVWVDGRTVAGPFAAGDQWFG